MKMNLWYSKWSWIASLFIALTSEGIGLSNYFGYISSGIIALVGFLPVIALTIHYIFVCVRLG